MKLFDLFGGRALKLAVFGVPFWQIAIPLIASGLSALFGLGKKKKTDPAMAQNQSAMSALLGQQQQQANEVEPLRQLMLGQGANLLPTYMKQDPNYASWLRNYGGAAQKAMTSHAAPYTPPPSDY
jgi:hypothetical protein